MTLGVLVWSRGVSWLTSVGYWPYDAAGFADAQSWNGANAPHFAGESQQDIPLARLLGPLPTDRLRALALERNDATGASRLRRQIVEIDGSTWLIADSVSGTRSEEVHRTFTASAAVQSTGVEGSEVDPTAKGSPMAARLTFLGALSAPPRFAVGHTWLTFVGWSVIESKPTPAPAISIEQEGPLSVVVSVLQVDEEQRLRALAKPSLRSGEKADSWSATVPTRATVPPP